MELIHPDFPRITLNSEVCFGKPCIKGTRMPISSVLSYLSSGMSMDEFLADFPYLSRADVLQTLAYASAMCSGKSSGISQTN